MHSAFFELSDSLIKVAATKTKTAYTPYPYAICHMLTFKNYDRIL